jgi:hypothetical protein
MWSDCESSGERHLGDEKAARLCPLDTPADNVADAAEIRGAEARDRNEVGWRYVGEICLDTGFDSCAVNAAPGRRSQRCRYMLAEFKPPTVRRFPEAV